MPRHGLLSLVAFTLVLSSVATSQAQTVIDEWPNIKAPAPPQLQSVTLDPKTTALLLVDIVKQTCNPERRPRCIAAVPKVQKLLTEARAKGVYIIYSLFPSPSPATFPDPKISDYIPELAPTGDEPVVTAFVDKFILRDKDTGLQKLLNDKGVKTLVLAGVASHNGVLFTSVSAALRGFNVVVPVDGMAGNNAYEDQAADYILTSSAVYKVTPTSIGMISFAN
jgi:nicotinamidase-related amidase